MAKAFLRSCLLATSLRPSLTPSFLPFSLPARSLPLSAPPSPSPPSLPAPSSLFPCTSLPTVDVVLGVSFADVYKLDTTVFEVRELFRYEHYFEIS